MKRSSVHVQSDLFPILKSAHVSDYDSYDNGYSGTGNVYPPVPLRNPNTPDIVTVIEGKGKGKTSNRAFNIFLVVVNIVTNVVMNVSLPVFAGTMDVIGGDTFVVLTVAALMFPVIFLIMALVMKFTFRPSISFRPGASWKILFIMGFATTLNGIMVVFASPPDKTPPYLQGILATMIIPYTVVSRLIILRKGIGKKKTVCTIIVLVGLFITIEPQIWGLEGSGITSGSGGGTNIFWPMMFALGFLPIGITNVICEKELKSDKSDALTFIMWTQVFQLLTILPLFWIDFIPGFGMAGDISTFRSHLHDGLLCCFSTAEHCNGLAGKMWIFLIGYSFGNLFQYLLIEYAEGAVYAVVVQSMVTPIATMFWTLFIFEPASNNFSWSPRFNITTAFTIGGLFIIVPTVIMYNYFSNEEAKEKKLEEDKIKDIIPGSL